jgi:FdhD protein
MSAKATAAAATAAATAEYERFDHGRFLTVDGAVVREAMVRLFVNGQELASLMCSPVELDLLALGFLSTEGLIQGPEEVRLIKVCPSATCVDVWLQRADFEVPGRRIITSGCAGGVTFADLAADQEPVRSDLRVGARQLCALTQALIEAADVHRAAGGIHAAALSDGANLLAVTEDIGRHNTIDKLWGRCLMERIPTQNRILLSTGRISSEMLHKAARMQVPVVASRTSPTSLSVALARAWNMTLVGYVRRDSLNVYAGRERITQDEEEQRYAHA